VTDPSVKLILASQSPRRAVLLAEAGFAFEQRSPPFADPDQPPEHLGGHEAEDYAAALAERKAHSLAATLDERCIVLAADTICVDRSDGLVGKPRDAAHARAMLRAFCGASHRVITGVSLWRVEPASGDRGWSVASCDRFAEAATVTFGAVSDATIEAYVATDQWRGKAGGYNLFDRQRAGWPIDVVGDPATVVGLPMQRLGPILRDLISIAR
jgi:septum formation protein